MQNDYTDQELYAAVYIYMLTEDGVEFPDAEQTALRTFKMDKPEDAARLREVYDQVTQVPEFHALAEEMTSEVDSVVAGIARV